jgi:Tfp pilus assembly protein PilV
MNIKTSAPQIAGRARGAFTLVEVMISVGILALMVIGLYSAFAFGFASIKTTREDERATQILEQKLEAVRLCTWLQLSNLQTSFVDYYDPLGTTNGRVGTVYYGTISATGTATNLIHGESYISQVHLITASVTWTNYLNSFKTTNSVVNKSPVPHSRQMQTLAAYNGIQNYTWGVSQ